MPLRPIQSIWIQQLGDLGVLRGVRMSRRKRGPVALRHWLSPGLPLSNVTTLYGAKGEWRQFGETRSKECLLWVALCLPEFYYLTGRSQASQFR